MTDEQNAAVETAVSSIVPAPRRQRALQQTATTSDQPIDVDDPVERIRAEAHRFSTMIATLKENERRLTDELSHANARIEQFEARVTELQSQVQTANIQKDAEIAARLKIEAVLTHVDTLIGEAFAQGR